MSAMVFLNTVIADMVRSYKKLWLPRTRRPEILDRSTQT